MTNLAYTNVKIHIYMFTHVYAQRHGEKLSRQENAIVVVFTFYGKPEKSVKPTQGRTFTMPITRTDLKWLLWSTPVSMLHSAFAPSHPKSAKVFV